MRNILLVLPAWMRNLLRFVGNLVRGVPFYGRGRVCPVCGKESRNFRSYGVPKRADAECVHCGALERHRFLWIFLNSHTDTFDGRGKKFLHVAPERCFQERLKARLGESYLTADLFNPRAMIRMDITDIKLEDESIDNIYCSHVLEHVLEDRKAMKEFHRILKPDGWAILLVPMSTTPTFEDPSIVDPQERLKYFGQEDHVRQYGPDYVDRLEEAGFKVKAWSVGDLFSVEEVVRMGLTPAAGDIFVCTKQ
jgi:hypothetical protein